MSKLQLNKRKELIDANYKGKFDLVSLIEACGNNFKFLSKNFFGYIAISLEEAEAGKDLTKIKQICSTPEIAVANLWLELNKKEKK